MDFDAEQFAADRQVDPNQLDILACTQADTFFKYAEMAVEANARADKLKVRIKLVEARLTKECRRNPENFGLDRVTEAGIEGAVPGHKDYVDVTFKFLRAKAYASLLDVAVQAMEQRKRMIEVLVTLHGQSYFAGPSVPRDLGASYTEYRKQVTEGVTSAQREVSRKRKRVAK